MAFAVAGALIWVPMDITWDGVTWEAAVAAGELTSPASLTSQRHVAKLRV
jgi:hypothetical protein